MDLTHVDNVVHAHLCAFESMKVNASLGGKAYFIGQNEPVFLWEWLNHIFTELGLPILEKAVPFKTAYQLGSIIEKLWGSSDKKRPAHDPFCGLPACSGSLVFIGSRPKGFRLPTHSLYGSGS